ncbi:unnamed protein product [Rotaria sordida]|uniref:Uncharacterized protein n=1 Tax=Rotaria sordida TaxID=392033 RepID=A0A819DP98_9BILA|nr:unnamed protein product [Rotaria sordida]
MYDDFAGIVGALYFRNLAAFCLIAKQTVTDSYRLFSAKTFITDHILPQSIFNNEANNLIDTFNKSIFSEVAHTLSLARVTINANPFASRTEIDAAFGVDNNYQIIIEPQYMAIYHEGPVIRTESCSCLVQNKDCSSYIRLFKSMDTSDRILIKSLVLQCVAIESALASTLECLYNRSCWDLIRINYARNGDTNLMDIPPLDANIVSVFSINDTVETLTYALLLENFTVNVSYDQFYAKCAPLSCTYTIQQPFNLIFLITSILAIYGILNKIFRLVLPFIVRLALIIWNRIRKQNSSINQSTSIVEGTQRNEHQ